MINSYTTYIKQTLVSTLLQKEHEFEHRRWIPEWGPKQPPEPAVGGSENWQVIMEPAPAADHPFFGQFQLQRQAGWRHAPAVGGCGQPSTIVREAAGQPMSTAYEARDVYVVNLPELFLHFLTFTMNGSGPRSSSATSPHEVKAARARARARARAAKKASARPRHGWGQSQEEQQEETQDTP